MHERELLLCTARTHIDAPVRARIEELLRAGPDWDGFLRLAHAHQVLPLVAAPLCGELAHLCPPSAIERMRIAMRAIALRNLVLARKLGTVARLLDAAAIPYVAYKGPTLSALAYGCGGLRQFGDLDVWVHHWDYHRSVPRALGDHGWAPCADYYFERSYASDDDGDRVVLDVHQFLSHPRSLPFAPRFETLRERGIDLEVAGARVRTLAAEDLALVLCVQLAKDMTDERSPPLVKVCDIAELVRNRPDLDWASLLRDARRLGVLHVVCVALAAAAKLLDAPLPAEVRDASRALVDLHGLVRHVEERMFGDGAGSAFSRPELRDPVAWNAAIRERRRDRSAALAALEQRVLQPNEYDYAFVRLPKRMNALYRLVKPLRLAWKHGRALLGVRSGAGAPGR
jgi:hypothetical protein